ncbi:MAG: hypothetical protein N2037_07325 [Acidimicrobiales bacterium]|nr:hypothetical protein [Acidimicrobiales bacterium]
MTVFPAETGIVTTTTALKPRLHGPVPEIAAAIRARVLPELGLTCSIGVGPNRFIAKLASERAKPVPTVDGPEFGSGVKVVATAAIREFLGPFRDVRTLTRSVTLPNATKSAAVLLREGRSLLGGIDRTPGVRLLGLSVSSLVVGVVRQLSLTSASGLTAGNTPMTHRLLGESRLGRMPTVRLTRCVARFGREAIGPASLLGEADLRVKRRGDQQWGPGAVPPAGT